MMKRTQILGLSALIVCAGVTFGSGANSAAAATRPNGQQSQQPAPTVASAVDRQISTIEKLVLEAAEAMPEDKFNFTPMSLRIPGSAYLGVRTFATQLKHMAASNWFIWSPLTGEKLPEGLDDGNGPRNLKTKADIIKFLKDSFALGHRAAATLTIENLLQDPGRIAPTRLSVATFGVEAAYQVYGQMIQYLRMNGIVPGTTRNQ